MFHTEITKNSKRTTEEDDERNGKDEESTAEIHDVTNHPRGGNEKVPARNLVVLEHRELFLKLLLGSVCSNARQTVDGRRDVRVDGRSS